MAVFVVVVIVDNVGNDVWVVVGIDDVTVILVLVVDLLRFCLCTQKYVCIILFLFV